MTPDEEQGVEVSADNQTDDVIGTLDLTEMPEAERPQSIREFMDSLPKDKSFTIRWDEDNQTVKAVRQQTP